MADENIIRGYWKCPWCETRDIDGLVDDCPNCGRHKPEDTKYYMRLGLTGKAMTEDILSDEELSKAGISREECDGEHEEWVCDFCNSLNNWADLYCKACGAARVDATKEYGMKELDGPTPDLSEFIEEDTTPSVIPRVVSIDWENVPSHRDASGNTIADNPRPSLWSRIRGFVSSHKKSIIGSGIAAVVAGIAAYLFWPIQEIQTATDFSWSRSIVIEEERTVKEDGWSVPFGGRVYDEKSEFHHYKQVIDHYETVSVQKSRQVLDHYEYSYTDNGNGTFTEHSSPVYRTEYYTESHQEPVYRNEPVYQTKYYYEIDKWFTDYTSNSEGNDHEPYWNTNYVLGENERDILRYEDYYIYYIDEEGDTGRIKSTYDEWAVIDYGDQVIVTTSRIGIDYKIESVRKE